MTISAKIKALLAVSSKEHAQLAQSLGISKQALSNKFYRDSFSGEDLIKIATFVNCTLAFIINGTQISLDKDDIASPDGTKI